MRTVVSYSFPTIVLIDSTARGDDLTLALSNSSSTYYRQINGYATFFSRLLIFGSARLILIASKTIITFRQITPI